MMGWRSSLVGLALLVTALASALVACGDEQSGPRGGDEEQIEALTARFASILAAEDAKAFCRVLAPNDRQRLGRGGSDGSDGREECLVVWGRGRNPLFAAKDPELEIETLSFQGAYATAKLANGGELGFAKEGGRWYVHLAPAPQQTGEAGA